MPDAHALKHIIQRPVNAAKRSPTLIMLHGFGSHEHDLLPLGHLLHQDLLVISVRAPIDLGPFGMFGGHAWFHLSQSPGGGIEYDEPGALQALNTVHAFLQEILEWPQVDADQLMLMGFSQGAMLTHGVTLEQQIPLLGAIACSGRMVETLFTPGRDLSRREQMPLFISHGTMDEVIPIESGRAIRDYYRQTPLDVTYREYAIGHGISDETIRDIQAWLPLPPAE